MIKIVQPIIEAEEVDGVIAVLKSGIIAQGPVTKEFEENFAKQCGSKFAVATSNGTTALHAALYAAGVSAGDSVITTPFTFVATANAILMQGAKPIFVDVDEETFCINTKLINKAIREDTKALLPVDLYGQPSEVQELESIAKKHSLKLIFDACQAIGATYNDRPVGSFGDASCFSLYATKNITTGEGGMITTNSEKIFELAKQFRHHGQSESQRYEYLDLGYNYRTTDFASAIGNAQLKKLERFTKARQENAAYYTKSFNNIPGLITPRVAPNRTHVFHQYTLRITEDFPIDRDQFVERLKAKEIMVGVYYPKPLHLFPQFKSLGHREGDFPVAEKLCKEVVSLPVHPLLSETDRQKVVEEIIKLSKE